MSNSSGIASGAQNTHNSGRPTAAGWVSRSLSIDSFHRVATVRSARSTGSGTDP
ncbi:hypothetical protein [Protofrankia sp. BMG5.30]|uniref:hypothetical protein n=1 Tax=Protofrankia sp. BMG5.30 TaxID=1834514 RepID=UPI00352A2936